MTTPPTHARTPNEQRIAALEAEVVTLREAMEAAVKDGSGRSGGSVYMIHREQWLALSAALSASTDYSDKVVVDGQQMIELRAELVVAAEATTPSATNNWLCRALARLDSLRKGDQE